MLSSPFSHVPFLLAPFLLLALIYLFVSPNDVHLSLRSAFARPCNTDSNAPAQPGAAAAADVDLRVLLGVLTVPSSYERRALLRLAYKLQPPPADAIVDVRFVFCNVTKEEDAVLVAMEIIAYDDIIVLSCTENMNDGKTYDFFSAIPRLFSSEHPRYDYVGKVDDDIYYRVSPLADALRSKARHDTYYGFEWPCDSETRPGDERFMVGWGYFVSWDVAAWISEAEELHGAAKGAEDMTFSRWLRRGGKGKNMYGEKPSRMYDYLNDGWGEKAACFRHNFTADTVAVHKLKDRRQWARALKFFNATQGLKPSKMYHLDL